MALRHVALVAGEPSGDLLGAALIRALRRRHHGLHVSGVGGPAMENEGFRSFFPMAEIAVNGFAPVVARLPLLLRRIHETSVLLAESDADGAVLIDSPDFTYRVAARVRRRRPKWPLVAYVSPTVWAWRPGRARAMRPLFDALLALLPFEPAAHARLGGPPTFYVGHPILERRHCFTPSPKDEAARKGNTLLVLPGSRESEVRRLLPLFQAACEALATERADLAITLPAVPHLVDRIRAQVMHWRIPVTVVAGEEEKWHAFRQARAALAASGTVTLELAMAGVPMVVAYRVGRIEGEIARRLITVDSAALPNLILGRRAIPEFIDRGWTNAELVGALRDLLDDGERRSQQLTALAEVQDVMASVGSNPSDAAADAVLAILGHGGGA